MNAVYAFLRISDDISDDGEVDALRKLDEWEAGYERMLEGKYSHPIHPALYETIRDHCIPHELLRQTLLGVRSDLTRSHFNDLYELEVYCNQVAGVVGCICLQIWGHAGWQDRSDAGIAFQYTNILRDIEEDKERGREYLREGMKRHADDTAGLSMNEVVAEIAMEAEQRYQLALRIFPGLKPAQRAMYQVMYETYHSLFRKLKAKGFPTAGPRVRLSKWEKLGIFLRAVPTRFGWCGWQGAAYAKQNAVSSFRAHSEAAGVPSPTKKHIVIVGGGLAGLSAAVRLAPHGHKITLLESRNRLGGRASSFVDPVTGEKIDACQHVTMGCCTYFQHFCKTVGIDDLLKTESTLHFMTKDGRVSDFTCDNLPGPFHLARSFAKLHTLTLIEKIRAGYALQKLVRQSKNDDPPFHAWLLKNGQTKRTIERFWNVVVVSALNACVEDVGLKYARKVFAEAFWKDKRGLEIQIPKVPLVELYGERLMDWFKQFDVTVELNAPVARFVDDRPWEGFRWLEMRDGRRIEADVCVCAVQPERVAGLRSGSTLQSLETFRLSQFVPSPITSVHLWFDRPVMDQPHVILVDGLSQWVFDKGEGYIQAVVSASNRTFPGWSNEAMEKAVLEELKIVFPKLREARLIRSRTITERHATFIPTPDVDCWRDMNRLSFFSRRLYAGDYTATGWPATMESAVRSGYAAADALIKSLS